MNNKQEIPEVGKYYHFWDDGKRSASRHYICRVEEIISIDKAKHIMVVTQDWDFDTNSNIPHKLSLYEQWEYNMTSCDWLYAKETDCFIRITCPVYDENDLYAVRTKDGGWFTIDVETSWQSGRLDVDDTPWNEMVEEYGEEHYPPADEEHYWKLF